MKVMPKIRKDRRNKNQRTNVLVGMFVTPDEKAELISVVPEGVSVSEFLRKLVLPFVKAELYKKKYLPKENND